MDAFTSIKVSVRQRGNEFLIVGSNAAITAALTSSTPAPAIPNPGTHQATTTFTNDTIDYTRGNWEVGSDSGGAQKANADFADLWFDASYLDITAAANRRKFIDGSGRPVNLGVDGSVPTGAAPLLYCSLLTNSVAGDFATNRGTGGNMTVTGTLELATGAAT